MTWFIFNQIEGSSSQLLLQIILNRPASPRALAPLDCFHRNKCTLYERPI